jgi:hypothetical protein
VLQGDIWKQLEHPDDTTAASDPVTERITP